MLSKLVTLVLCLLILTACGSVNPRGVDTHDKTIPIYNKKW